MVRGLAFTAFAVVIACSTVRAQQPSYVTILPAEPKAGDVLTITYDPSVKGAVLVGVKAVTAEILFVKAETTPQLVEVPMKKQGKQWTGSTTIGESAILFQVRFVAGETVDDNGENVWSRMVMDRTGTALRGANMALGMTMMYGSVPGFKVTKDPESALAACEVDVRQYPNDWKIASSYWNVLMRVKPTEETKGRVEKDFRRLWEAHASNEDAAAALLPWFERLGHKAEGDSITAVLVAASPRGKIAERARQNEVYQERDAGNRADLLERFLRDFPQQGDAADGKQAQLASFALMAGRYGEGLRLAAALRKPDNYVGMMLNDAAWRLTEKGEKLDTAVILAERGVAMARSTDASSRPSYMSRSDWERSHKSNLGMVLDTYGFALYKLSRTKEAQKAYAEAVDLMGGKEADINERYVECLNANGDFKTAMDVCSRSVRANLTSDRLLELYRAAYVNVKGSEQGFDRLIEEEKAGAKKAEERKLVQGMMNKPAIGFALKDLGGRTVTLQSLRGKVVVVDFWATWCGPCKSSFPFLQQVFEKYKSNPSVMILALNTWENKAGAEREALVNAFLADNKYTFPVLYDEGIVEKYGVEGIPTKFVIDKRGIIRFKSVGFENGPKMVGELTTQIDMLLGDTFYQKTAK